MKDEPNASMPASNPETFSRNERNRVRRVAARGHYDERTVFEILDSTAVGHVGFNVDDQPYVIPMIYGRDGHDVILHGAPASRLLKRLSAGAPACLTVTQVDGLVLARSAFHHSMNYRSVVAFGTARALSIEEKPHALQIVTEHFLPGRWEEVRQPNEKELRSTEVLCMHIESASAKIRTGPPKDEPEDFDLPIWAGVVPQFTQHGIPIADSETSDDQPIPNSVLRRLGQSDV